MKVDSQKKRDNGFREGPSAKSSSPMTLPCLKEKKEEDEMLDVEGTTMMTNGYVSGENLSTVSRSSPYSVSEIDSRIDDALWSETETTGTDAQMEAESSDLDDIVTTGTDVCHAATLEAFLENLEFIPSEVDRILKLIGTLDEKCEEITELLEQPSEDWFALHRTKKQRKSTVMDQVDTSLIHGEGMQNVIGNGSHDMMIYRKIYEGQDGIGFEAYKARLARARKLERQKQMERRANEVIAIPDIEFQIDYEKDEESPDGMDTKHGDGGTQPEQQTDTAAAQSSTPKPWDGRTEGAAESLDGNGQLNPMCTEKKPMDAVDRYFHQLEQETVSLEGTQIHPFMIPRDSTERRVGGAGDFMEMDCEGLGLEEATMGDDWKERLEEILQENRLNSLERNDLEKLDSFMETQLTLLWRYTLRKKALTRKAYEMVLHHYASLVQELEPNEFGASIKCYPEATVVQDSLLNELEEQFMSVEEMAELYKDVEELLSHCDDHEDIGIGGYATVPSDPKLPPEPTCTSRIEPYAYSNSFRVVCASPAAAFVKQEENSVTPLFSQESGRKLLMDESFPNEKAAGVASCPPRHPANGAISMYSPSTGSAQAYARSEGPTNIGDGNSRRARSKRHKAAKTPSGMSHAAKSPQLMGRLLTYHDIATPESAAKLSGHPAELFWPHDDLWYLININVIHPDTKKADIVYVTGDTETLELDDIVREGHMSLLPEVEDTDLSAAEDIPQQAADVDVGEEAGSELSASEMRGASLEDPSPDDEEIGSEDEEEEVMVNIRSRQSRRAELKADNIHAQRKSL